MSTRLFSVSPQHLHRLQSQGQSIDLIDVRTPAEFRAGHATGAKLVPLNELNPEQLGSELHNPEAGHDPPLYVICHSGARAQQAAERLMTSGYDNVLLVDGGTQAWEKAGLPMKRCGKAISLERQVQITIGALLILKVFFGFTISELFFAAAALIGTGLIIAGTTGWCGMARLVALMPWNNKSDCSGRTVTT